MKRAAADHQSRLSDGGHHPAEISAFARGRDLRSDAYIVHVLLGAIDPTLGCEMNTPFVAVRCPRCGSMDAGTVEEVGIEFDRMRCNTCGYEEIADDNQIRFDWNERVSASEVRLDQRVLLPDARFCELWRALGAEGHGRPVFERLRAAYDEPHRAYHTARHIGACLRLLDEPAVHALATHPAEVEAAIWFHDAVYDTHASDNEERSAVLAGEALRAAGVALEVTARIADHIRATQSHVTLSADGALVMDVDLSILGADAAGFERFEEEIRHEYSWVDAALYRHGRAAVLREFEERPFIYATPLFRDRLESIARANIAASLKRLGDDPKVLA